MRNTLFGLSICIAILIFFETPLQCLEKGVHLTLIYTSNTLGEVEPCLTCPESGGNGGLARRAHFIKNIKNGSFPVLVLDAGDAMAIDYFRQEKEREKARRRAEVVLKIYEKIGYDAVNLGDIDIGLGIDYLRKLRDQTRISFLSANLKERKTGKPPFNPYLIKEVEGIRIGIIGLLTPSLPSHFQKEMTEYFIDDPVKVVTDLKKSSLLDCHYLFALAHLTPSEIEFFAKRVPEISLIIGGQDRSFVFPKKINRSLIIQSDAFGFHVGKIDLRLLRSSLEWVDISPQRKLQKNIEELQKKIEETKDENEKKNLKEVKKRLMEQERKLPVPGEYNAFENTLVLMHPKLESDKEIEDLIEVSRDQLKRPIPY